MSTCKKHNVKANQTKQAEERTFLKTLYQLTDSAYVFSDLKTFIHSCFNYIVVVIHRHTFNVF